MPQQGKKKDINAEKAERFKAVFGRYPKGYTPPKAPTATETLRERKAAIELGTQPLETAADTAFARSKGILPKDKDAAKTSFAEILRERKAKRELASGPAKESFGGTSARLGGEIGKLTGEIGKVKKGREVAGEEALPVTSPLEQAAITGLEEGAMSKADTLRFNTNLKRLGFKNFTEGIETLKLAESRKVEFDSMVEDILKNVRPPALVTPEQAQQQAAQALAQKYGKDISFIEDVIGIINAIKQ